MVSVSASVNLPLHHKVQKFSSGTGSPGWSWKNGRKTAVVVWWLEWVTVESSDLVKMLTIAGTVQWILNRGRGLGHVNHF